MTDIEKKLVEFARYVLTQGQLTKDAAHEAEMLGLVTRVHHDSSGDWSRVNPTASVRRLGH